MTRICGTILLNFRVLDEIRPLLLKSVAKKAVPRVQVAHLIKTMIDIASRLVVNCLPKFFSETKLSCELHLEIFLSSSI